MFVIKKPIFTRKRIISLIIIVVLLLTAYFLDTHLTFSSTKSNSYRLFFITKNVNVKNLKSGDYVLFDFSKDKHVREVSGKSNTTVLIKRVGCTSGENLVVVNRKYFCNGNYLCTAKRYSLKKRPLSNFIYNGTIPEGKVFVFGDKKDSYDSRYFGFIDEKEIFAKAYPIL
jgi:signal peptidase I/conjugal transfer pilin signal peptidase TrbI